jgi:hypothetical protein
LLRPHLKRRDTVGKQRNSRPPIRNPPIDLFHLLDIFGVNQQLGSLPFQVDQPRALCCVFGFSFGQRGNGIAAGEWNLHGQLSSKACAEQ